jgi:hypothetical protein
LTERAVGRDGKDGKPGRRAVRGGYVSSVQLDELEMRSEIHHTMNRKKGRPREDMTHVTQAPVT